MSFWIKGSSTDYLDFSNDLAAILENNSVSVAAVNAGGSGYVVGDILTVAGGTALVAAQAEVTSVAAGVIDGIRIFNAGSYSVDPTTTANAVTGGSGSGATVDLTMSGLGWTVDVDQVWDGGSEREVIAHGEGGGADAIYVGWRTFSNVGGDYYNWELHGMTGYTAGLGINEQPNTSPGNHENEDDTPGRGCYLILNQNSFNWWLNISPYRIIVTVNIGGSYWHAYMGWGNRFGTSSEYPYPMLIAAPSAQFDQNNTTPEKLSSITDPWMGNSWLEGHTWLYGPGGAWIQGVNKKRGSPQDDCVVVPTQKPQIASFTPGTEQDWFMGTQRSFYTFNEATSNNDGNPPDAIFRLTGTTDAHIMFPCFYVQTTVSGAQVLFEIDECRWCFNFGGVTSEDRFIEDDGTAWRVFANGNRSDIYAYIAIKESD